ncbi:Uncharacterised protein [Bordetella pertussis]|nr:Uncharacterised protein [Bordetella pertussis]CFW36114.1 Uncharacterised protein [Bordetella pertussis]
MQRNDVVEIGQGRGVGGARARGASVVDQPDNVVGLGHFPGDGQRLRFIGQVGLVRRQALRRIGGQAVIDVDDTVAGIEQGAGDGRADAGRGAGDQVGGGFHGWAP